LAVGLRRIPLPVEVLQLLVGTLRQENPRVAASAENGSDLPKPVDDETTPPTEAQLPLEVAVGEDHDLERFGIRIERAALHHPDHDLAGPKCPVEVVLGREGGRYDRRERVDDNPQRPRRNISLVANEHERHIHPLMNE